MKQIEKAVILEGPLAGFLHRYLINLRECCETFYNFKDETIIYSLLEYSKFVRPYTKVERIKYLFEKCCEFEQVKVGPSIKVISELEENDIDGPYFISYKEVNDDLPF